MCVSVRDITPQESGSVGAGEGGRLVSFADRVGQDRCLEKWLGFLTG